MDLNNILVKILKIQIYIIFYLKLKQHFLYNNNFNNNNKKENIKDIKYYIIKMINLCNHKYKN